MRETSIAHLRNFLALLEQGHFKRVAEARIAELKNMEVGGRVALVLLVLLLVLRMAVPGHVRGARGTRDSSDHVLIPLCHLAHAQHATCIHMRHAPPPPPNTHPHLHTGGLW